MHIMKFVVIVGLSYGLIYAEDSMRNYNGIII